MLITFYFFALSALQVPTGILAERTGERILLVLGTVLAGIGFLLMGLPDGPGLLAVTLVVAGLGSSVQHPLGSTLVASAYGPEGRRIAIGTYNFSGDLGKMLFPVVGGLALAYADWTTIAIGLGGLTVIAAIVLALVLSRMQVGGRPDGRHETADQDDAPAGGIHDRKRFLVLSAIAVFDTVTRYGLLTLLPFLLLAHGANESTIGLAFGLLFAGGAAGKFLCGVSAQKWGVLPTVWITETITGGGILALLVTSESVTMVLLPIIGAALNGTSSVLYGSVADYVSADRQARAYGIFYTVVIASGAVSPVACGVLSDLISLEAALATVAAMALVALPLSWLLREPVVVSDR